MRLIHYSAEPLDAVQSVQQDDEPMDKPHGLWVSADDAWKRWCETESFHLDRLACAAEIVLAGNRVASTRTDCLVPDAQVLRIGTVQALDEFTLQYGFPSKLWPRSIVYTSVLWSGLAKDYAGIIIAPYLYQRRLDGNANWYYGYDCACGCIWDAGAIAEVRPITLV